MKTVIALIFPLLLCLSSLAQPSEFIHVDQFGYAPDAEKVAVLSNPMVGYNSNLSYSPAGNLQVRTDGNNQVVYSGAATVWNSGSLDPVAGDQGWWFDFSSVNTPGSYHIYDPASGEQSASFEIVTNPYEKVMQTAGRMFYYNRCNLDKALPYADSNWTDGNNFNNALQDANCRYIYNPTDASLEKDLSGGWFDAGDYNKYVSFTYSTLHNLLSAYETNPQAFGDNWNIPESGNGLPDVLDEVKWELDWLLKMTNPDGTTHIKVGSQNYQENTNSPPSANTDPRFYGPTCTSASATVASVFAHAALVFDDFPAWQGFANTLRQKAEAAYAYVLPLFNSNMLETNCDDGSIVSGDADVDADGQRDMLLTASIYLFEITNQNSYEQFIFGNAQLTEALTSGYWGAEDIIVNDAMLRYAFAVGAVTIPANAILMSSTAAVMNNTHQIFGWTNKDLYRAFVPDWSYYWGSNQTKANFGSFNTMMARYGIAVDSANQARKAAEHLHYFHGVNPLGMVYLSNMYALGGDRCANQIYHTWFYDGTIYDHALTSPRGPAPGYVPGGPNEFFSVTTLSPPAGQPKLKSYLDFNDGFPLSSWEITEPAIYYQAAYIRLLSDATVASTITAHQAPDPEPKIVLVPNPARDQVRLQGLPTAARVQVYDLLGHKLAEFPEIRNFQAIDLRAFPAGLLLFRVQMAPEQAALTLRLFHGL